MKTRSLKVTVLVIAALVLPGALYAQEAAQPGDSIGEMSLRSGGSDGPPIWAFCSPVFANVGVTTVDCTVPALPELAIGHGIFGADEARRDAIWDAQTWELYLDGQQVDLGAFGSEEGDLPLAPGQPGYDPNQQVIAKLRGWDVVVVNPTAGAHTLRSVMKLSQVADNGFHTMAAGTYDLVITFTVEAATLPVTGGGMPAETLPHWQWLGVTGLLVLALGVGLWRVAVRAR